MRGIPYLFDIFYLHCTQSPRVKVLRKAKYCRCYRARNTNICQSVSVSATRRTKKAFQAEGRLDTLQAAFANREEECKLAFWATDGVIFETQGPHFPGRQQVATVENDRTRHDTAKPFPIKVVEFRPVCREDQSLGLMGDVIGV